MQESIARLDDAQGQKRLSQSSQRKTLNLVWALNPINSPFLANFALREKIHFVMV
jgi:hypothetical protein